MTPRRRRKFCERSNARRQSECHPTAGRRPRDGSLVGAWCSIAFSARWWPLLPTEPPPFMRLEKLTRNLSCMNRGEDESTRCGNAVILVTKNRETRHQYARGGKSVCPTQVKEKGWSLFWRRAIPRCGRGNPGPTAIPPVARVWLRRLVAKRCQNTSPHSSISEQHDPARRCTPVAMFPGPVP